MMSQKGLSLIENDITIKNLHLLNKFKNVKKKSQSFWHAKKVFDNPELLKISLEILKRKEGKA